MSAGRPGGVGLRGSRKSPLFLRDGRGINLVKYKNPDDPTLVDTKTKGNSTNLNWGPNYQGTIRIGYCIK